MRPTRAALVLLTMAIAACQPTSPLTTPAKPQAAHVMTEAELVGHAAPVTLDKTVVLSLEHPQDASGGTDSGTRGVDHVPVHVTTETLHRFHLKDENGEAHGLRLLDDKGGEVVALSGHGTVEKLLAAGRYLLEVRHSGQGDAGTPQTAFVHPVVEEDGAIGVKVSINHCQGCDLTGAKLTNAPLKNVVFLDSDLSQADLRGADLTGTFFSATSVDGANTAGTSFAAAQAAGAEPTAVTRGWEDREDNTIYTVVVNHEEQYSIWPADRELPLSWNHAGKTGSKQECLAYIEEVWTDMRPKSLREKMEEAARQRG